MTPDLLRAAGIALFGTRWQADMARATKRHRNSIARWERGEDPIPDDVREALWTLAAKRMADLEWLSTALAS